MLPMVWLAAYCEAGSTINKVRATVAGMRTAHLDAAGLAAAADTAARLLGADGELLTVLRGVGVDPRTVDDLADALATSHPGVELIALDLSLIHICRCRRSYAC